MMNQNLSASGLAMRAEILDDESAFCGQCGQYNAAIFTFPASSPGTRFNLGWSGRPDQRFEILWAWVSGTHDVDIHGVSSQRSSQCAIAQHWRRDWSVHQIKTRLEFCAHKFYWINRRHKRSTWSVHERVLKVNCRCAQGHLTQCQFVTHATWMSIFHGTVMWKLFFS